MSDWSATDATTRHVWLSDEFSVPEASLCWHVPPSPNADHRCIRAKGHPGAHEHWMTPDVRDYSWKDRTP